MRPFLESLNNHLALLVAISGALVILVPRVRKAVVWCLRWVGGNLGGKKLDRILALAETNRAEIKDTRAEISEVRRQFEFNGGSTMFDMLHVVVRRQNQGFWRSLRPAIEMDENAMVELVSESLCNLIGVHDPQELRDRNWLRFVESGRVDDFLRAFADTTDFRSSFAFDMDLRSYSGVPLGRWELRLAPVSHPTARRKLYEGYFRPVTDDAINAHDQQVCRTCFVPSADCSGIRGSRRPNCGAHEQGGSAPGDGTG